MRRNVIHDYWVFNSVFYARTYDKLQLRRDDILLDVGANIGLVTLYFYDKVNKILAIEPEPDNFRMLRHNVQTNNCKNVITVNKAVSDERGFTQFDHTGGEAIAKQAESGILMDTLENIMNEWGIIPTAIKMDIEGFELKAMKGFSRYDNLRQIIMEVHSKNLQSDVSKLLANQGFSVEFVKENFVHGAILNVLKHPAAFLKSEKLHNYDISRRYSRYLLGLSKDRPTEYRSGDYDSDIKILYARKL